MRWVSRSRFHEWLRRAAWLIPLAYLVAAIVFGIAIPRLDRAIGDALPARFGVGAAQGILTAFATGLITIIGLVMSVIIAGLTFSATAVTPRIVREWQRNTTLQHVFGLLLFSVVYAFLVLYRVGPANDPTYVPDLAVWMTVPLLALDVVALLLLVAQITHALRLVEVIDAVHERARDVIEHIYPARLGLGDDGAPPSRLPSHNHVVLNTGRSGVVTGIDADSLISDAAHWNTTFELACAIGTYVARGAPLFYLADWPDGLKESHLQDAVTFTDERTIDQDPLYAIRLLVDIAIRALSAAVNDPSTAVQALDRIEDLLRMLAERRLDRGGLRDDHGALRLIVPLPGWDDFLAVGLTEIARYGLTSIQVLRRLRALVDGLQNSVPPVRRGALDAQAARLDRIIERAITDPVERKLARVADRQGLGDATELPAPRHA